MTEYLAFLRGININGKNKVPMAELKALFESLNFINVKTVLNSGNVKFESEEDNENSVLETIKKCLSKAYEFDIPVFVIKKSDLDEILKHAPEWWNTGDKTFYDNLIFIMNEKTFEEIYNAVGEPKPELEKICSYKNVIFWTYLLKDYQKSNWWKKTATTEIKNFITIRTAGTVFKCL